MIHSRHLQQCIGLTIGAITTGLAIRHRNRILNLIRQNQRQKFDYDIWVIYSGPQTLNWINNNLLPKLANKNIALDITCGMPGKFRSDNILEIAAKSERVIIVLGPDILDNKWLKYQIAIALKREQKKISIYSLDTIDGSNDRANEIKHLRIVNVPQMHQILQNPCIECQFEFDFWVIYSGQKSQQWGLNTLMPIAQEVDKTIAIDIDCYLPGKNNFDNVIETAKKSQKVIIVLSPETYPNELFRYEIEHALMKGPQKVVVCQLGPVVIGPPCLRPLREVHINQTKPNEDIVAIKQLLNN